MKDILCVFVALIMAGCKPCCEHDDATDDIQVRIALRDTLLEARLAVYDNKESLSSVSELQKILEENGHLSALRIYGHTNIFFNPKMEIWKKSLLRAGNKPKNWAIIVRRGRNDYLGITVDSRFMKTNCPPAEWCE